MDEMYEMKEFLIANGMSQLPDSSMTNDLSPYDYFDGGLNVEVDPEFSEVRGRRKKRTSRRRQISRPRRRRNSIGGFFERSQKRRDKRRADKRRETAMNQRAIADVQKQSEMDAQLLAQLGQADNTAKTTSNVGMSKTTKISLIVGGVAVALLLGFVVYKKMKK